MSKQDDFVVALEAAFVSSTTGTDALDVNVALRVGVQTILEAYVARGEEIAGEPTPILPAVGMKAVVELLAKNVVLGMHEEPETLRWGAPTLYGLDAAREGFEDYVAEKIWS